ncbi:hypothetical protein AW736_08315 [Termitidicoccus mucosus]|uniref:Uncharacterized protein n=1 Tax=Termitidicoccus mucosus TaxID=1184151 RepID=A0A178ILX8_9BACT|nr:hypothetical protein AW736_08315 [Opitutaceae bacterium TSB47]
MLPLFPSGTDIPAPATESPPLPPAPQARNELQPHAAKSHAASKTTVTVFFIMPGKKQSRRPRSSLIARPMLAENTPSSIVMLHG